MKVKIILAFICLFAGIANAVDAAVKRTDYKSARTGSWDETKILEEVEHAVKNNVGQVPASAGGAPNQYYGFSKDGKIKIEFYYNDANGIINSFFPTLKIY